MSKPLTLYDTGERLEPRPWSLEHPDRYGLVDFDDDEGTTVFTVVGKKPDDSVIAGYRLSIGACTGTPIVEVNGDRVLVLDEGLLVRLSALVEFARRGRSDFQHQAETTSDYTDEDIAAADAAWSLAQQAIRGIEGEQP